MLNIQNFQAFPNFDAAARGVLEFLHQKTGFDLCMITRTEGDNWIVLKSKDCSYGVRDGSVFKWQDSFCSQMVIGNGPRIAPCSDKIPAYANAPIRKQLEIGAYLGVPLVCEDGSLFGTLCAVHPTSLPEAIVDELPLIELLAGLLSFLLNTELKTSELSRSKELAQAEAMSDELTKLYNRRGWNHLLAYEEERCRQYGHPACVIAIDLNGLKLVNDTQGHAKGDELIQRTGRALRQAVRKQDVVARVGGDEFVVLCVKCNLKNGMKLVKRLKLVFESAEVNASFGIAERKPDEGLKQAWIEADLAMYVSKKKSQALR